MCTYRTERLRVTGSAKGARGWFRVTDASVYLDHPVHALAEHTLNVDLRNPGEGAAARVAMELDPVAARALAESILRLLDEASADAPRADRAGPAIGGSGERIDPIRSRKAPLAEEGVSRPRRAPDAATR